MKNNLNNIGCAYDNKLSLFLLHFISYLIYKQH